MPADETMIAAASGRGHGCSLLFSNETRAGTVGCSAPTAATGGRI